MDNENMPAFPNDIHESQIESDYKFKGLTKREYFAGLAMQGLVNL